MPSKSRAGRGSRSSARRAERGGSVPVLFEPQRGNGTGTVGPRIRRLTGQRTPAAGSCHAPATDCRVAFPFGVAACPCGRRAARPTAAFRSPDRAERKPPAPKALGRPTMRVPRAPPPCRGDRDRPGLCRRRDRRGSGTAARGVAPTGSEGRPLGRGRRVPGSMAARDGLDGVPARCRARPDGGAIPDKARAMGYNPAALGAYGLRAARFRPSLHWADSQGGANAYRGEVGLPTFCLSEGAQ